MQGHGGDEDGSDQVCYHADDHDEGGGDAAEEFAYGEGGHETRWDDGAVPCCQQEGGYSVELGGEDGGVVDLLSLDMGELEIQRVDLPRSRSRPSRRRCSRGQRLCRC